MTCQICEKIKGKNIYEDEKVIAFLEEKPMSLGHIALTTKEHFTIIEQVPDFIINHLFKIANKIGIAVFESLGALGTNILVNNGIPAGQEHPHFVINIIPRRQNDNINFRFKPKQLNEEEMSTVELTLKEQAKNIGAFEKEPAKPIEMEKEAQKISGENYMTKVLRR